MLCSKAKFAVATKMDCCRKRKISQVSDSCDLEVTVLEKDNKQTRAAMLKKRFANVIFKSAQQLLLGNEFEEEQIKKKKENQLREENLKVELMKTQRQIEREAARIAIERIKRTVDFDDSLKAERELLMLTKVHMLKNTRNYSFLLSDDAELPAPSRGSLPHKASAANFEGRVALPPSSKQYSSSNTGRRMLNDREVLSQMQSKLLNQKSVSVSKQTQLALDSRKQLASSKGSGPLKPKAAPPKIIGGPNSKRVLTPGVKSTVPAALHKPTPSMLQPSIPRQSLVQQKEIVLQSGKSKVMPKQAEPSYRPKPITQKQAVAPLSKMPPKNATLSLEDRSLARKPTRHDEDDDDGAEAISMIIRRMFGYNPNIYRDDDDDTSDMEANFDEILREEKQSAKIAKEEDEEELRKIEEEERRERLRKQAKKCKLSHQ